jgi:hypothetical protein
VKQNNSKDIVDTKHKILEILASGQIKGDPRWISFLENQIKGLNVYQSAKLAGFSEKYSKTSIYNTLKKGGPVTKILRPLLERAPETAQAITRLRMLTDGLEIEKRALQRYLDDPDLAIKYPALLKHLRQVAGLQAEDVPQVNWAVIAQQGRKVMQAIMAGKGVTFGPPDRQNICSVVIDDGPGEMKLVREDGSVKIIGPPKKRLADRKRIASGRESDDSE